jgi:glycosyltransferase involved in cell wall biosynthesis
MSRVSVLIPTAARPETLEVTLRAVSRQVSRDDLIAEVIVSENLSDRRSEAIVSKFPELPIKYVFREPVFDRGFDHVYRLFCEAQSEFVAFVCDDDVWSPGHLAAAVESLDRNPDVVARFSAAYQAESELAYTAHQWASPLLWLAAGRPDRFSEYVYDLAQVLALGWVLTPFHWSTLVGRREPVLAAGPPMVNTPHPYYGDRMLILALAELGPLVFDPAVDTLYRVYEGNWVAGQDPFYLKGLIAECEAMVYDRASELGIDLPDTWRGLLSDMPKGIAADVKMWLGGRFTPEEMAGYGFAPLLPSDAPRRPLPARAMNRLRNAVRVLVGKGI